MDSDSFTRLEQLQKQMAQLGELATSLAAATPRQAEGTDATGWVRVLIAHDGLPRVKVRNGWNRRIEANLLGAAVVEANADAINSAMRAWSNELDASSWWTRRAGPEEDELAPSGGHASTPPAGVARDPSELTEEVLSALQAVRRQQPAAPADCEGSDPNRHVTVQLGQGGLLSCTIDPRWAARRDGDAITAAVSRALQAAVAKRSATQAPTPDLDGLVGDALATLRAVTQLPRPGGID
jgi:DNA-binding protein YbaB